MTERERLRQLRVDARLAHEAMLAHATAVSEAGAGFHRVSRRRLRFVAPSRNYAAVRRWVYHAQPSHAVDLPRLDRASELAAARCRALVKRLREEACDA